MKLTAKVKLLPTPEQATALTGTVETANAACNYASERAWETRTFGRYNLHHLVYHDLRTRFGLTAQVVVRLISKVSDAYKLDRQAKRTFRSHGAISYDARILSWRLSDESVSIWTIEGRLRIPYAAGERQRELLRQQRGESDLCLIDGEFYLFATCEWDEPGPSEVTEFLGVDLGIKSIAADSDGEVHAGGQVNGLRRRHRRLRARLQQKGTRAAKRLLHKRKRKEARFATHVNHCISKHIVAKAKDTCRGIAIEELNGIRSRVTVRRSQRATLHSWAFHQLRSFLEYKATLAGVPIVSVDPRHTSQECPACGFVSRSNRPSQSIFSCISCGFAGPADTVAAGNIARRAAVNWPGFSPATVGQGKAPSLAAG
ncbi:MAG: transposase [Chloroflexota bacterium]